MRVRPLAVLVLALVVAGCASPPSAPPPPAPPPGIRIPEGDARLPQGHDALLEGEVPSFAVFADPVNMTRGGAHREVSLALDPADARMVLACSPSGVPDTEHGQSYYYLSRDNGTTWQDLQVETEATDARKATFEGGDCDVAFDAGGAMYSADSWLGAIAVGSSRDGGATWAASSVAAGGAPVADRPWLVGGPAGTVHLTYQDVQFGMPSAIWYTRSADYGTTWTPPALVAGATADGPYTWTGNYAVSPDGNDLYSIFTRRSGGLVGTPGGGEAETVWVSASHDAGATWTPLKVSDRPSSASFLYPSIAMDAAGNLHAAFAQRDGTDQPVWYTRSTDQGATWSPPVPLARGLLGYSPWIAAGQAGQAAVVFYGSPDTGAGLGQKSDWYVYVARIAGNASAPAITVAATTAKPVFSGTHDSGNVFGAPEFDMVRIDAAGGIHLAASVPHGDGGNKVWTARYQRQADGPAT